MEPANRARIAAALTCSLSADHSEFHDEDCACVDSGYVAVFRDASDGKHGCGVSRGLQPTEEMAAATHASWLYSQRSSRWLNVPCLFIGRCSCPCCWSWRSVAPMNEKMLRSPIRGLD